MKFVKCIEPDVTMEKLKKNKIYKVYVESSLHYVVVPKGKIKNDGWFKFRFQEVKVNENILKILYESKLNE